MLPRLAFLLIVATAAHADEGMWTYDALPLKQLASKYRFTPAPGWADHLRASALRIASGCSASFVSSRGLVLTDQHCARACAAGLSDAGHDFVAAGFTTAADGDEKRCPDMEIDQLVSITPVTETVHAATANLTGAAFATAERHATEKLEAACATTPQTRCDVVTLFHGGKYDLYTYRRYRDVRLAFIGENEAANFGDPDRADWPYHVFDAALLRVYDGGHPLDTTADHLSPAAAPPRAGDLVFLAGDPGQTDRLETTAELEALRDVRLAPLMLDMAELHGMAAEAARHDPDTARAINEAVTASELETDRYRKQHETLSVGSVLDDKRRAEAALRARVDADPALRAKYAAAWDDAARAAVHERDIAALYGPLFSEAYQPSARLWTSALAIVLADEEREKPDADRIPYFRDSQIPELHDFALASAPMNRDVEQRLLAWQLTRVEAHTGTSHPVYRALFGDESEASLAARLVRDTRLTDGAERKRLWDGGAAALRASTDPLVVFLRDKWLPPLLRVQKDWSDNVAGVYTRTAALIDQARFALDGADAAPDATFSPRLAFGGVRGYDWYGATMPTFTTIGEAFALDGPSTGFHLPDRWRAHRADLPPDTPLDMVAAVDIVGGNSGSPVVDRDGRLVGLCFAGNDAAEQNTFANNDATARAIAVTWPALRTLLRAAYGEGRLVDEIEH